MKPIQKYLIWTIMSVFLPISAASCSSSDDNPTVVANGARFTLPAKIDIMPGGDFTFSVTDGTVPSTSDFFMLEASNGVLYISPVISVTENSFTVKFDKKVTEGSYHAFIKSGDRRIPLGMLSVAIVESIIEPAEGATIYGLVSTPQGGVKGVVVSDGVEVTTTDDNGVYNLKSNKQYGYVFISVPSGYEVEADGVLPRMYHLTTADKSTAERADFRLTEVPGQDTYKVFFLGDMHLANRTDDAAQFKQFTADFNKYRSSCNGQKMYAVTLGDMTWDLYWYDNKYQITDYIKTINEQVKGIQIFHTMGNHDYDYKAFNDFDAALQYRTHLTPGYYSFNIGKVHYVVLDDIDCDGYDGTTARLYTKNLSDDQLAWLAKDLAYVNKSTPLIITAHAPFFRPTETGSYKYDHDATSTDKLLTLLDGYKVHFVTGHTHMNYNVPAKHAVSGGRDIMEHNVAAICASWWWSGHLTPGMHLSTDGTPGGYAIWDINGTDIKWIYKGTNLSENVQFHSYDLNKVKFSASDVPEMSGSAKVTKEFDKYTDAYPANSNNEVLINVWNWDPSWTITVTTESGQNLTCTPVTAYDPLHIAALTVKRFNKANLSSVPSFITEEFVHFFKVKAPDATSTLKITVKDQFGNTWTEDMKRPKAFSTDAYMGK